MDEVVCFMPASRTWQSPHALNLDRKLFRSRSRGVPDPGEPNQDPGAWGLLSITPPTNSELPTRRSFGAGTIVHGSPWSGPGLMTL